MSFHELGLAEPLLRAVTAEGYTIPTPIQLQAIPLLLAGRDLLGTAQTGTGKTAAFALPVLQRLMQSEARPAAVQRPRIRALIICPTRELACQIGNSFDVYGRHAGLRHVTIFGGVGQGPQTQALRRGVDILVATPGRLVDLMGQGFIDLRSLEMFVLDEADRMLDMGFLPDIRRVVAELPNRRQTVFLSATMPDPIARLADSLLRNPARVQIVPVKATADLIEQSVCFVDQKHKSRFLATFLKTRKIERALVFTRTKHGADRVVRQLAMSGIRAEAIHGNKSQSVRQRTLANFKSSRTRILVATDIAARGIDVDAVSHVLNYDLPHEPETYLHRIGRTGRAGATGFAVSFCGSDERSLLRSIERMMRKPLPVDSSVKIDTSTPEPIAERPADHERPAHHERAANHDQAGQHARTGQHERPAQAERSGRHEGQSQGHQPRFVRGPKPPQAGGPRKGQKGRKFRKRRGERVHTS